MFPNGPCQYGPGRAKQRARLDAERVEQVRELAVQVATERGDGGMREAGQHRAWLVDGEPDPVAGVDVDERAQRRVQHDRRVMAVDMPARMPSVGLAGAPGIQRGDDGLVPADEPLVGLANIEDQPGSPMRNQQVARDLPAAHCHVSEVSPHAG